MGGCLFWEGFSSVSSTLTSTSEISAWGLQKLRDSLDIVIITFTSSFMSTSRSPSARCLRACETHLIKRCFIVVARMGSEEVARGLWGVPHEAHLEALSV